MLLSAVSVLVVAQSSSEILEGLMNNPVSVKQSVHCTFETDVIATSAVLIATLCSVRNLR